MTARDAKRLHNEDEVVLKDTDESIQVLSVKVEARQVLIEGVGTQSGYGTWTHTEVR